MLEFHSIEIIQKCPRKIMISGSISISIMKNVDDVEIGLKLGRI